MTIKTSSLFVGLVFLLSVGCTSTFVRPNLYPNSYLLNKPKAEVEADLKRCNELADTYVKDASQYNQIARDSLAGAAIGSASGALAGTIVGSNVGRSVGAGAAVGAIVPLLQSLFQNHQPSPDRESFVKLCLKDKGYQVL